VWSRLRFARILPTTAGSRTDLLPYRHEIALRTNRPKRVDLFSNVLTEELGARSSPLLLPDRVAGFIQATLGYCDSRIHFLSSSRLVY
jgi:hypothetical protein